MNSIEKVNKICKAVRKLTPDDFECVSRMADEQRRYTHPLKGGKQSKLNATGDYNFKVIAALQNLKDIIDSRDV